MTPDRLYMQRALELATLGRGRTRPNPMVGAVIVHQGRIIGEGYHRAWGGPHAEVMAIGAVARQELLRQSTMYVTLEPCSHHGKTPPCCDLIIERGIPRVHVAMADPYPQVAGRGIERLRAHGIEVHVGLMQAEAERLNAPFVVQHTLGRPYISLKWARSSDGFLDRLRSSSAEAPVVFSSPYRQRLVHRARMEHQAILVGYRTALLDDPSLTNRYWPGHQPLRIVLDPRLELPQGLKVKTDGHTPTYVLYAPTLLEGRPIPTDTALVRYLPIDSTQPLPLEVCRVLSQQGIQSVLVEGGSATLQQFIDLGLYDHVEVEYSSLRLGQGVSAPRM